MIKIFSQSHNCTGSCAFKVPKEFRCCPCFVYNFLSLTTSIISTFLNLSKLLCSFLLNFSTSTLTHDLLIKSYLCGALIRITLVWFAFVTNSNVSYPLSSCSSQCHYSPPPLQSITPSFFINS